ncbi:MAG: MBL fold metallo-hydrolase [Deltaproteobacteria bacterium]|nr:MBL fold metallo-hydrolase [Deltaproteobacteria bacterium]MCL4874524.1 MBL fold metallo-hydrolase [bacterium]
MVLHNLDVGCGDASIIISGASTFLIDCHKIEDHQNLLPKHKFLRGVFITHQHRDHFSGLHFLKDNDYRIENLIFSPYKRRHADSSVEYDEWIEFESLKKHFQNRGTTIHQPYRQENLSLAWWPINNIEFRVVGPNSRIANEETRELHDACLVVHVRMGGRKILFTGDASDKSLEFISNNTSNFCDDILHASHHGSINGAFAPFIKACNAQYTVISTKEGVYENVPHPDALIEYQKHTSQKVYRTDRDGALKWSF